MACYLGTVACYAVECSGIGAELLNALANGCYDGAQVLRNLFLEVAVANGAIVPLLVEVLISIGRGGDAQEGEQVLDDLRFLAVGLGGSAIGYGSELLCSSNQYSL